MLDVPPRQERTFEHRSVIATSLEHMVAFHEDPRALRRLTPPLVVMQQIKDERTSLTAGEVEFRLWFGPIPVRWLARHEPGPTGTSFADLMLRGPLAYWRHEHVFTQVEGGVELADRIRFAHKAGLPGVFTRLIFDGLALRLVFVYRHWVTRLALRR